MNDNQVLLDAIQVHWKACDGAMELRLLYSEIILRNEELFERSSAESSEKKTLFALIVY